MKTRETGMKKTKAANIKVRAACITGPVHLGRGQLCQDRCRWSTRGANFVAVVSDGAGSTKYGRIGAKIVCDTLVDLLENAPFKDIRAAIVKAIGVARDKLAFHRLNSANNKKGIMAFAATVVGVVCHKGEGLFFHIGDGAALAFTSSDLSSYVASKPENGVFACETYFYTMDDWQESLRFTAFKEAHTVMLMSDGLTNFSFAPDFSRIEPNFLLPINDFLNREKQQLRAVRALTNTLNTTRAKRLNPDDKTFLWARL